MLTIKNLTAGYGGPPILENVHIQVHEGEIVTIIGPNGAGKSTILRSIFGLTQIHTGELCFFDEDLKGRATSQITRKGICYVPQGRCLFPNLTVEENLILGAFIEEDKTIIRNNLDSVYQKFPNLRQRAESPARLLSGGQQQMVALGRSLMMQPKLLLLDEPSIGLSPKIVAEIFEKIKEINAHGTTILMVEQNAVSALEISDRGYVLELGKNKFEAPASQLLEDPRILEAYLGKK